jgi:dTDP-4-amino-4,6-dideoxygalactose transaminase
VTNQRQSAKASAGARAAARPPSEGTAEPFLPFARPSITAREKAAVLDVLDSGWLSTGPETKRFESEFASFVGSGNAVALNSATAGLHLALEALGVGPGDEVIVPTWTFAASAEVAIWLGARPVLVDVDRRTLNATAEGIVAAITPRTRAVVAVHVAGCPADLGELIAHPGRSGVRIVEDAAHAFPSRVPPDGRFAGTLGDVGVYSFYATKTITTGEGGMLVTDDPAIADRARLMSLHGITRSAWNRYSSGGSWSYEIEDAGFKYNMGDIAAAIGRVQLARSHELLEARRALVAAYRQRLTSSSASHLLELPDDPGDGSHAWHLFIVRLALDRLGLDRAAVIEALREDGVGSSVHFIPLHLHPLYRDRFGYRPSDLPIATAEFERVISLPLWPGMTSRDVDRVCASLERVLTAHERR